MLTSAGVLAKVEVCANPVNVDLAFYWDNQEAFQYDINGQISFAIPGLSVDIPGVGVGIGATSF